MAHGRQVIDFERSTGALFEPSLQAFFLPAHWVIDFANQVYLNAQFSIAIGFLLWLYLFRNESYYFVRNMFVVAMGSRWSATRSTRRRRRGCSPNTASSTRSTTSQASTTTPGWRRNSSTLRGGAEHALRLRDDDRRDRRRWSAATGCPKHGGPPGRC